MSARPACEDWLPSNLAGFLFLIFWPVAKAALTLDAGREQKQNMIEDTERRRLREVAAARLHGPVTFGEISLGTGLALARGRVHEAVGDSADMFALAAASATKGPVLWIGPTRDVGSLAPSGLQAFVDPARLILVTAGDRGETLWAGETALRARAAPCAILEMRDGPDLTESRRLQIAAETSGGVGIILIHRRVQTSAAETRWSCNASAAGGWTWICTKSKRGRPSVWQANWRGGTHAPDLVALAASASA